MELNKFIPGDLTHHGKFSDFKEFLDPFRPPIVPQGEIMAQKPKYAKNEGDVRSLSMKQSIQIKFQTPNVFIWAQTSKLRGTYNRVTGKNFVLCCFNLLMKISSN